MEGTFLGVAGLIAMVGLVTLGVPIAFASALVGFLGIGISTSWGAAAAMAGFLPFAVVSPYGMTVIPLFILMGCLAFHGGLTEDIFGTARKWLGHLPGGLAIATSYACAGFGACCGSSVATAAIFSRLAIPEMKQSGYDPKLAAGVVASSGTIAIMIPPSTTMVVYGILTDQSVAKLLLAGFLPGVLIATVLALITYIQVHFKPGLFRPLPPAPWKQRFISIKNIWGLVFLIALIMGGLYSGVFTPTEAGGIGAFGALSIGLLKRKLSLSKFKDALLETGRTTVMIYAIVVGVFFFTHFLASTGLPQKVGDLVTGLALPKLYIMAAIILVFTIAGMFIEAIGMMMLILPFAFPLVLSLGYDPIWFGVITVLMVEIGQLTPPVGVNLFVVKMGVPDMSLMDIIKGTLPYLVGLFIVTILLILFPQIALFIPSQAMGR